VVSPSEKKSTLQRIINPPPTPPPPFSPEPTEFSQMSPTQQLKHWQQILETLPTETTTKRRAETQIEEKPTETTKRKTDDKPRPENWESLSKKAKSHWRKNHTPK